MQPTAPAAESSREVVTGPSLGLPPLKPNPARKLARRSQSSATSEITPVDEDAPLEVGASPPCQTALSLEMFHSPSPFAWLWEPPRLPQTLYCQPRHALPSVEQLLCNPELGVGHLCALSMEAWVCPWSAIRSRSYRPLPLL